MNAGDTVRLLDTVPTAGGDIPAGAVLTVERVYSDRGIWFVNLSGGGGKGPRVSRLAVERVERVEQA